MMIPRWDRSLLGAANSWSERMNETIEHKGLKKVRGFTLIELLVTMGIMAVVITLTIPAFTGLGRGTKMNSALSGLKNTFSLARQWAISHRDTVYVLFPTEGTTEE